MDKVRFVQQVTDVLYRIYNIRRRMKPTVKVEVEAYFDRHTGDYAALSYGADDSRLARFVHNRIVPLSRSDGH